MIEEPIVEVLSRASVEALTEIANASLGFEMPTVIGRSAKLPAGEQGALISLVGTVPATLGLFGTPDSCATIARAFLGTAVGEELALLDTVDGVSEIVNMVAGGSKRRVPSLSGAQLGLPVFVMGDVLFLHGVDVISVALRLGQAKMTLVAITKVMVFR